MQQTGPLRRLGRVLGPALLSTVLALAVLCATGELLARSAAPFADPSWPSRVDASAGTTFQPGAEVRWTYYVDFWTTTRANSIGFLDREPPGRKRPGTRRVLFIGDSFVEAAQVPIEQKAHVVLERLHRERFPARRIETMALGYSGTGQVNQLPFYDAFGRDFAADVVVLVIAHNDFANNSAVLEAVRNGWHPEHAPRVDIIYAHANMSPDLITAAAKNGAKGIVVAGVGDGNMTAPAFDELKRVAGQGVVRSGHHAPTAGSSGGTSS